MKWTITTQFNQIDEVHHTPHKGIDVACPQGTPVHAIEDGQVDYILHEGHRSFGTSVWVHSRIGEVIYGHLSHADVAVGQYVHTGQVIALSGNTGDSTGPHIHLQINAVHHWWDFIHSHVVDPSPFVGVMMDGTSYVQSTLPDVLAGVCTILIAFRLMKKAFWLR